MAVMSKARKIEIAAALPTTMDAHHVCYHLVAVGNDESGLYKYQNQRVGGTGWRILRPDGTEQDWGVVAIGGAMRPKLAPNGQWHWLRESDWDAMSAARKAARIAAEQAVAVEPPSMPIALVVEPNTATLEMLAQAAQRENMTPEQMALTILRHWADMERNCQRVYGGMALPRKG